METMRQQKIARLIQKELADVFLREGKRLFGGAMISVTKAYVSKDLSVARVYVSIFGAKETNEKILDQIKAHSREIRTNFAGRVKSQLRIIPELDFFIDDSLDYIENIDRLLKE